MFDWHHVEWLDEAVGGGATLSLLPKKFKVNRRNKMFSRDWYMVLDVKTEPITSVDKRGTSVRIEMRNDEVLRLRFDRSTVEQVDRIFDRYRVSFGVMRPDVEKMLAQVAAWKAEAAAQADPDEDEDDFDFRVAGTSYHADTLQELLADEGSMDADDDEFQSIRVAGKLVREPKNEHDANAVAVYALDQLIGYAPRAVAAEIAPELDALKPSGRMNVQVLIEGRLDGLIGAKVIVD